MASSTIAALMEPLPNEMLKKKKRGTAEAPLVVDKESIWLV
jgi:hypothetical protein